MADIFFFMMSGLVGVNSFISCHTRNHGMRFLALLMASDLVASWLIQLAATGALRPVLSAAFDLAVIFILIAKRNLFMEKAVIGFLATCLYLLMILVNLWYAVTHGANSLFYYTLEDVLFLILLFVNVQGSMANGGVGVGWGGGGGHLRRRHHNPHVGGA